ncbi:MAG: NADH-quinone oxidoreductase subunit L, partial [Thiohalorhabdaceae bacterium]
YGFDALYDRVFAEGGLGLGRILWQRGDVAAIDGAAVNGTAARVRQLAGRMRGFQSGYIYHYAFSMLIGVFVLISWYLFT